MDVYTFIDGIGNDLKQSINDLIQQIKILREEVELLKQKKVT